LVPFLRTTKKGTKVFSSIRNQPKRNVQRKKITSQKKHRTAIKY